ncbi:hypothetical protein [Streptomyces sp. NPDC017993]|uniref:hypothetical protein n=1 Tax=Streptomyces sp. NPDC017993 TaxID=3365027 RepID=UPI003791573F
MPVMLRPALSYWFCWFCWFPLVRPALLVQPTPLVRLAQPVRRARLLLLPCGGGGGAVGAVVR